MNYLLTHRVTVYMLFVGLLLLGFISLYKSSVSLMPNTTQPGISIIIEYPGVAPEKIETLITKPVEKIVKTVSGIESINSASEEGKARININFNLDTNVKIAALKVREKIALIRPYFPREVQEPVVVRYDPSDKPVVIATAHVEGKTLAELRELADRKLKPQLQRIEGVSEINIAGGLIGEIHVDVDRMHFEARAQTFKEVAGVIEKNNVSLPGGAMFSANKEYNVYTDSRYKSISEIADTLILRFARENPGIPIAIKDIATVRYAFRDKDDIARLNGEERVTIYIHKAGDANALTVSKQALAVLAANPFCKTTVIYNQGSYITAAIRNVFSSGIGGIIIVVIVLSLFMRRAPVVIAIGLSIPVTLVMVFGCMYFMKIQLNIMSLSGLALAAGMIVDNGIVLSESIYSSHTKSTVDADSISRAIALVKTALISSTGTTIIVFVPIVFGDKALQNAYGDLAFTVTFALVISLVVSMVLVPTLIFEWELSKKTRHAGRNPLSHISLVHGRIREVCQSIALAMERLEHAALQKYDEILRSAFLYKRRLIPALGVMAFIALILLTLLKSEMIDPLETHEFYAYLEFPTGTSLTETDKAVKQVEEKIKAMNVTEKLSTKVEKWRGTLAITLSSSITSENAKQSVKRTIKKEGNAIMQKYNGFVFLSEADEIAARELSIMFIGEDNETLRLLATQAARKIQTIKGIEECVLRFREGRPEYRLFVDRDKANSLGLYAADITGFLRSALYGPVITKFVSHDREIDVRIKYTAEYKKTIDDIMNYTLANTEGALVPLKELVTLEEGVAPSKIWRFNGRRMVSITAKIGSLAFPEAAKKIEKELRAVQFPEQYTFEFDENLKKMQENRAQVALSVALAILLVYMILASLFESLRLPIIIMTTVPLALIGVILILFVTGSTMNISVYIGMIVLAGIVVNNGIILVNTVNQYYHEKKLTKKNLEAKIREVCLSRFRPVLITTLTTVLGMVPMLIASGEGSNLWRPLALSVISGLTFSTALTLVVVPVFSYYMYEKKLQAK